MRLVASALAVLAILIASSLPVSAAGVKQCKTDKDCKSGYHCAGFLSRMEGTCVKPK
jgi:hypothetical protein